MVEAAKNKPFKSASVPLFGIHTIYGADGDHATPYMTRIWFGRLRLHIFHRGDADPDCHDHPWDFWTFPLTSYVEEVAEWDPVMPNTMRGTFKLRRQVVRAFRLTYRPATHCHRVIGRFVGVQDIFGDVHPESVKAAEKLVRDHFFPFEFATDTRRIITIVWRSGLERKWGFLRNRDGRWCWTPWKEYVFGGGKNAPCGPKDGAE